jgi:two-component system cell cycle response regulator CpdR
MSTSRKLRVLVVDDDVDVREFLRDLLAEDGIEAHFVESGPAALKLLEAEPYDLLLTDIRMPQMDGFELVQRARQKRPDLRVLYMSGYAAEYRMDPKRDDFVAKPFRSRELLGCIYEIVGRRDGGLNRL